MLTPDTREHKKGLQFGNRLKKKTQFSPKTQKDAKLVLPWATKWFGRNIFCSRRPDILRCSCFYWRGDSCLLCQALISVSGPLGGAASGLVAFRVEIKRLSQTEFSPPTPWTPAQAGAGEWLFCAIALAILFPSPAIGLSYSQDVVTTDRQAGASASPEWTECERQAERAACAKRRVCLAWPRAVEE